jgi:hypothetical protein
VLCKKDKRNTKDRKLTSNATMLAEKRYIRMLPTAWRNLSSSCSALQPSLTRTRTLHCGSMIPSNYVLKDLKPVSVFSIRRGEILEVLVPPLLFHFRVPFHSPRFICSGECMTTAGLRRFFTVPELCISTG